MDCRNPEVPLMSDDFETVYKRASDRVGDSVWAGLSTHEQTVETYNELRAFDSASRSLLPEQNDKSVPPGPIAVRVRLIGQMGAWTIANESVLPSGRKTRALLAAIALSAPRPALRGRLAELLWSRRPEDQARVSLRQEIQFLLKALGAAKTEILQVTRDHLSLKTGVVWIDVQEVMRATVSHPASLSLLDGELLEDLDGTDPSFDMWLTAERERLRGRSRDVAEALLREQTELGPIIHAARRLLQIDRTHEESWRALMRAYAAQGERGMAIQAYDRCHVVLADLLDAEPSAETRKLMTEIRGPSSKQLPMRPVPRPAPPPAAIVAVPDTDVEEASHPGGARVGVHPMKCIGLSEEISYLGPSLANEITMALSRFRRVCVVATGSLAKFARDKCDGAAIRESLGIDFLLDGTIQYSRNKLRISLRLIDLCANNQVVWARRLDRQADDLLAAQEDIASVVVAQIDAAMMQAEVKRGAERQTAGTSAHNLAGTSAYDLIVRSIPLLTRLERDAFMRGGEQLERAIVLEPEHAGAHSWYASWHTLLISQDWAFDVAAASVRANDLAKRAIVLEPTAAAGFSVAGHVRAILFRNLNEAAALHERALALNPNLPVAWALSAITCAFQGELHEAERRFHRYKALSPIDPFSFVFDGLFVMVHLLKHDHHATLTAGRAVTQLNPLCTQGYKPYLAALGHLGLGQEAEIVSRRLLAMEPNFTVERFLSTSPFERPADRDHYATGLRLAGVPEKGAG
jgi:DNA-binding SARP family transcriptional activator/TolB-like protein